MKTTRGKIYLLPNVISPFEHERQLNPFVKEIAENLSYYICEHAKNLRAFLKVLSIPSPYDHLTINELNKHTDSFSLPSFLEPIEAGHDIGLVSDAGCPGIADPGAEIVRIAHEKGVRVIPLVGPSSITLTLMASGLNGQGFAFNGYLPPNENAFKQRIKSLESEVMKAGISHIFIETPYRNEKVFQWLGKYLSGHTMLCVGTAVMGENESIRTMSISQWRKTKVDFMKQPTVFIIGR